MPDLNLNSRAQQLCAQLIADCEPLRIKIVSAPCGSRIIDCGIETVGGLEAGRRLAEVCMAGLGRVDFVPAPDGMPSGVAVAVATDHPVAACMASQYAGWQVTVGKYFAMGSGPMRVLSAKEPLFERIGYREKSSTAVGVLETGVMPTDEVCRKLAADCGVAPHDLTLLVAPSASRAGLVQVVARSIETALHKLFELAFDLERIEGGWGIAPLPCAAKNDIEAIGRANDAILYGGQVTLWVKGDDASLEAVGPRVPSSASTDYGQPFAKIFEKYNRDFYKIDPHLFSPAAVNFANVDTGCMHCFGHTDAQIVRQSFGVSRADG